MSRTRPTPKELLDLIAEKAEALRKAGVQQIELEGCAFVLTPWFDPKLLTSPPDEEPKSIWDDPATFAHTGRKGVPRLRRPNLEEPE